MSQPHQVTEVTETLQAIKRFDSESTKPLVNQAQCAGDYVTITLLVRWSAVSGAGRGWWLLGAAARIASYATHIINGDLALCNRKVNT